MVCIITKKGESKMANYDYDEPSKIQYCPFCGESISDRDSDGTCECTSCKKRFGVVEIL